MGKSREESVRKIKHIMTLFIMCFLVGSLAIQSTAGQLSDYQKKLEQTNSEKSKLDKKIKRTEDDINWNKKKRENLVKELEALGLEKKDVEQQVQLLESALISLDDAIAAAEEEYAQQLELLKERLRVMHMKSSTVWEIDALLQCKNINELFIRIRFMKQISENDQRLLDSVEAKRLEIEDLKDQKQYEMENCVAQVQLYKQQMEELEVSRSTLDKEIKSDQRSLEQYVKDEDALIKQSEEWEALIKSYKSSSVYKGGKLVWPMPTNKNIYSWYGNRIHPIYKVWKMHTGIDIGSAMNEGIVAAGDGVVIYAGSRSGYGNTVVIDHGGGITTLYAHINSRGILVKAGQLVTAGQKIAKAGRTGTATGPHLHFEVRKDGKTQNPLEYVPEP